MTVLVWVVDCGNVVVGRDVVVVAGSDVADGDVGIDRPFSDNLKTCFFTSLLVSCRHTFHRQTSPLFFRNINVGFKIQGLEGLSSNNKKFVTVHDFKFGLRHLETYVMDENQILHPRF